MNIDLQNRSPRCEKQPDGRLRVTRILDCLNNIPKDPAELLAKVWIDWGTPDPEFTNCRLVKQDVSGQEGPFRKPCEEPPQLVRVYEEIAAAPAETMVGEPGVSWDQYDNRIVVIDYVAFSAGTATYQIPGVTAAPAPNQDAILKTEERADDGTLYRIRRTYSSGGILSDTEELRFGGKLKLRTIRSLNEVPATPSGYTLVTTGTDFTRGLELYIYGFAAGGGGGGGGTGTGGIISTDITYHQSSDQGTTGVTVETIRYLTDLSIVANPITTPSGLVLISVDFETEAGYKLWTGVYAKGIGEVDRRYSLTYGGRSSTPEDAGAQGVNTVTIRHLTATSVTSNPTSNPNNLCVLIDIDHQDQDGYRLWTAVWVNGSTDRVVTATETREGAHLIIYHRVGYGVEPGTPDPTIGGTVTQFSSDTKMANGYAIYDYQWAEGQGEISRDIEYSQSSDQGTNGATKTTIRYLVDAGATVQPVGLVGSALVGQTFVDQDGYRIWTTVWGKGAGTVITDVEIKDGAKLYLYHRVALGSAPSTPSATIGGTVTLISTDVRNADGYAIYDYKWAEGKGTIDLTTRPRNDGSIEHVVITLSATPELPAAPGFPGSFNYSRILAGTALYCIALKTDLQDGYSVNTATWIEPPTNRSTEKRTVTFTVPGLAVAANPPTFSPPISRRLLAQAFEYWGTSPNPNSDTPYTITNWASLQEEYEIADSGQQVSNITALDGYVGSSSATGSNTTYRGIDVTAYAVAVGGSTPTAKPTGLTVLDLEWEPYLTDINGVIVWKTTVLKFTF